MIEVWKVIPTLRYFEISSKGRIRTVSRQVRFVSKKGKECWRLKKSKILKTQFQNCGYEIIKLSSDNVSNARTIHSLVAQAFLGKRPRKMDVCHNNGNKKDNRLENLRYDTRSNNHKDRRYHGTVYSSSTQAKLTFAQARKIKKLKNKMDKKTIAREFGIQVEQVRRIWRGEAWKYL